MSRVELHEGDCLETLRTLPDNSVDSVVTDPPYHLTSIVKRFGGTNAAPAKVGQTGAFARASRGFMGQTWDGTEMPAMTADLAHWLAGFADGEGCFTTRRNGHGYACEFVIHVRADDAAIIREIAAATGVGVVRGPQDRGDGSSPMVKWVVSRQNDCAKLVQLFEAFPLRAKKARDFAIWASAVREWIAHEPGTSWEDLASHAEMLSAVKLYGSAFNASQFFHYRWARMVFRVLKPGGHIAAFGGTRTFHRLASALEDAGFEIRDQLAWTYSQGFPKSHDLGRKLEDWQGWGTALKPAWEPICLARKPLTGTVAENVLAHGVGALNVDGCRIAIGDEKIVPNVRDTSNAHEGWVRPWMENKDKDAARQQKAYSAMQDLGRWPANILHDGEAGFGEQGRFFYCAKASKADREDGNNHPTVKPTDLMRWLCRLITPPGGVVLDPFTGSGSTGKAAVLEGFGFIGMELSAEYAAIARRRITGAGGVFAVPAVSVMTTDIIECEGIFG